MRNAYTINVRNMEARPRSVILSVEGLAGALMWTDAQVREQASATLVLAVAPDQVHKARVYVAAPERQRSDIAFVIRADDAKGGSDRERSVFEGPEGGP